MENHNAGDVDKSFDFLSDGNVDKCFDNSNAGNVDKFSDNSKAVNADKSFDIPSTGNVDISFDNHNNGNAECLFCDKQTRRIPSKRHYCIRASEQSKNIIHTYASLKQDISLLEKLKTENIFLPFNLLGYISQKKLSEHKC